MIRMPNALREAGLSAKMLLQVHDELVLECPTDEIDAAVAVVRDAMEGAYTLDIPLRTDARYGTNWGALEAV